VLYELEWVQHPNGGHYPRRFLEEGFLPLEAEPLWEIEYMYECTNCNGPACGRLMWCECGFGVGEWSLFKSMSAAHYAEELTCLEFSIDSWVDSLQEHQACIDLIEDYNDPELQRHLDHKSQAEWFILHFERMFNKFNAWLAKYDLGYAEDHE